MDPPGNNRAMAEKLALPFPLLSDPEGELARRCGVWNEQEGVAEPTIIVLDRSGEVRYAYAGSSICRADRGNWPQHCPKRGL